MSTVLDVFNYLDKIAPFNTAMSFDNVGILVGNKHNKVEKCLIALDITNDVIVEAKGLNVNLIVSHHPIIFNPLKKLEADSVVYNLVQSEITAICAHTNFDMAAHGVNYWLAEALSLKNVDALSYYESNGLLLPMGLIGELKEAYNCDDFAGFVKDKLNCKGLRYTHANRRIKKVAVCSGAGGDLIGKVICKAADAFVTGEIKHHEILAAGSVDICVVDAGHFKTENIAMLPLTKMLSDTFFDIEFIASITCTDKIKYIV